MCENCGKSFASKEYLKHHNRIHSGFRPYKCETCGRAFAQRNSLHQHMKIHTGIFHKLSNIDMHFTQKVKSHVLKHIDNTKQFKLQFYDRHQCAINNCIRNIVLDWQLLSNAQNARLLNSNLSADTAAFFTGERPYHCKDCDKQFTQLNALQRHQRIHTGEKPYMCSMCGRTFTDKSTVRRHTLVKIHSTF